MKEISQTTTQNFCDYSGIYTPKSKLKTQHQHQLMGRLSVNQNPIENKHLFRLLVDGDALNVDDRPARLLSKVRARLGGAAAARTRSALLLSSASC